MGPVTSYLVDVSTKSDQKAVAQQPDAILFVRLERICSLQSFFLFFWVVFSISE